MNRMSKNTTLVLTFFIVTFLTVKETNSSDTEKITELVKQWAPLVWLAPGEKYMPLGVEQFLNNVIVTGENNAFQVKGTHFFPKYNTQSLFLVTKQKLEELKSNASSFLFGLNPKENSVPMYAVVNQCSSPRTLRNSHPNSIQNDINIAMNKEAPGLYFHVSYWTFYPYNEGKEVCFIGNVPAPTIFGRCFGHMKTMGNHVGDWEHMSLSFQGNSYPTDLFLAVHDAGVYYKFDPRLQIFKYYSQVSKKAVQDPKFPYIVRMVGGHPVLFSARGSHGLWAASGEHSFVRVPRLYDSNGYGTPWKGWKNLNVFHVGVSILPDWMLFKGRWGNPKSNCLISRKLGICENSDGPTGIIMKKPDFFCFQIT